MNKYELYLFDFDGTLVNTIPSLVHVFENAYKAVNISIDPKEVTMFARRPLKDCFLEKGGKEEDYLFFVDKINEFLNTPETVSYSKTFEDTMDFIKELRNQNIYAGIVTSNNVPHIQEVLKFLNIPIDTFQIYIGNWECKKHKPDPEPILKALERDTKHLSKREVVYVGDALNDCLSAKNADVPAILLDRDNEFDNVTEYPIIHSLMELLK